MRVPNFVTVLGVRLCMTAEGLFTLYQIPAAVFSAKGASLNEKFRGGVSGSRSLKGSRCAFCAPFYPIRR